MREGRQRRREGGRRTGRCALSSSTSAAPPDAKTRLALRTRSEGPAPAPKGPAHAPLQTPSSHTSGVPQKAHQSTGFQARKGEGLWLWSPRWAPLCSLLIPLLLSGHNFDFCYSNFSKIFSLLLLHKPYYRYPLFLSWYLLNSTFGFLRGQAAQT